MPVTIQAADLDDAIRLRQDMRTVKTMRELLATGFTPTILMSGPGIGGLNDHRLNVPLNEAIDLFRRIFDAMDAAARAQLRKLDVEPE